jgi:hypothetical protein
MEDSSRRASIDLSRHKLDPDFPFFYGEIQF